MPKYPVHHVKMEVDLPEWEEFFVVFRDDVLAGEIELLQDPYAWATNWGQIMEIVSRYIVAWNLVDQEGRELPLPSEEPDVLKRVPSILLYWMASALTEVPVRGLPFRLRAESSAGESGKPSSVEPSAGRRRSSGSR